MQAKNIDIKTSIRYIKGVGPRKAELLARLGLSTVEDVLYYLPRRYEDRSSLKHIRDLTIGQPQTVKGRVLTLGVRKAKTGMHIFQLAVGDDTGVIHGIWFNQPFMMRYFKIGQAVILHGKVERYKELQIHQPEYEILRSEEKATIHMERIVPIYPLTQDVSQRYMRSLVYHALKYYASAEGEILPTQLRAKHKFVDIHFALRNAHFPANFDALGRAHKRLVFNEFFILQMAIALKKKRVSKDTVGISHKSDEELLQMFQDNLPFELTESQRKAIGDIEGDMKSTRPMNRLLEGDVGSGKTIVAAFAMLLSIKNKHQAALMAPTEILAKQHYTTLRELLAQYNVRIELLVSSIPPDRKEEIRSAIKNGNVDLIIGTHALIQEGIDFSNLGLVVIDEQHKFGVTQRARLRQKRSVADVLVMTATPIPRSLALTVYGDLDMSVMRGMPQGRRPVTTYWVEESQREKIYDFVKEEIAKGRQVYVVCPAIRRSQRANVKTATKMHEKLATDVFKDYTVGMIHGKMKTGDKDRIMKTFKEGKLQVLVSTVVIEVGIDVPNATIMVIENAERFGLAQLHQMRGRIGRGTHESYCILLSDPKTAGAQRRLKTMSETADGFEIAEEDLQLRGPGELMGTRQHGLPEVRLGNVLSDAEVMELARKEAGILVQEDPELSDPRHYYLRTTLKARFTNRQELVHVG